MSRFDHRYEDELQWRPRDRADYEHDVDREQEHLDSSYRQARDHSDSQAQGERWRNLDYYRSGQGFNTVGSDYLRDVVVKEERSSQPSSVRGPQSGIGPKNYTRSDDRIREDICDRLTAHGLVNASEIDVIVKQGEVTLEGQVDNLQSRGLVDELFNDIDGIREVHNHLSTSDREDRSK